MLYYDAERIAALLEPVEGDYEGLVLALAVGRNVLDALEQELELAILSSQAECIVDAGGRHIGDDSVLGSNEASRKRALAFAASNDDECQRLEIEMYYAKARIRILEARRDAMRFDAEHRQLEPLTGAVEPRTEAARYVYCVTIYKMVRTAAGHMPGESLGLYAAFDNEPAASATARLWQERQATNDINDRKALVDVCEVKSSPGLSL